MDDNKELIDFLQDKKLKTIKERYNFSIITNVILIIVIVCIGVYVVMNLEEFKSLSSDVCRLCEEKTGGTCSYIPSISNITKEYTFPNLSNLNLSK